LGPVLAGEADAIRALVRGIGPRVLRVVRQVLGSGHPEAEDVMQDAIFGVLEALPAFRGESGVLHFASRVALLTAMNARRRLRLRERHASELPPEGLDAFQAPGSSPALELDARRRRRAVEALLGELPPAQAEALAMHLILGFTIAETAEACGVPENTVRSRLLTAKAALKRSVVESDVLTGDFGSRTKGAS
jgi:RNA polymerase sigma-70 factor (ECF subfamily)